MTAISILRLPNCDLYADQFLHRKNCFAIYVGFYHPFTFLFYSLIHLALNYRSTYIADEYADEYTTLLRTVGTVGTWQPITTMFILSAVIEAQIISFYPPTGNQTAHPNNCVIRGRDVNERKRPTITIMWTSVSGQSNPFQPNHFVPLVTKVQSHLTVCCLFMLSLTVCLHDCVAFCR